MRSLPSPKRHDGSLCLPVTLHDSFFFLLEFMRFSLYSLKIVSHRMTCEKAEVMEAEIPSLNDPALETWSPPFFEMLMRFFFCSHTPYK